MPYIPVIVLTHVTIAMTTFQPCNIEGTIKTETQTDTVVRRSPRFELHLICHAMSYIESLALGKWDLERQKENKKGGEEGCWCSFGMFS